MAIIGAVSGAVFAAILFNFAYAAPSADEDNNKLEQLVSQNDACRLIVYQRDGGMIRLYFPNKTEAEFAARRILKQTRENAGTNVQILSPDCDIDVGNP